VSEHFYDPEAGDLRLPPHSELLNQVAAYIPLEAIPTPEIQQDIDQMFRVAYGRQGGESHPTLVGLAGPQIGISKRIVLIGITDITGGEQPVLQEFINPVILAASEETEEGREGCFSTGNVTGIVERAQWIILQGYNRFAELLQLQLFGLPARVGQHELDHLDGIRIPDRIDDPVKLHWVEEHMYGDYRQSWRVWPLLCPPEVWAAMRAGLPFEAPEA